MSNGVNRGLFSNEAGQGSAPIAHSAARAHEPVSEGMVAILEPFIDTICICTLTGLVLLSSGVWNQKLENQFQETDMQFIVGEYDENNEEDRLALFHHVNDRKSFPKLDVFNGTLEIEDGVMLNENISLLHAESVAEDYFFYIGETEFSGQITIEEGKMKFDENDKPPFKERVKGLFTKTASEKIIVQGKSLMHSAPLTTKAYEKSFLGEWGKYIVSIGLLLFAFSTAISWSYYGGRAVTFLFGTQYIIYYRFVYVIAFFLASFTDTTIIWSLSYITIALMAIPNLVGILVLHKDIKSTIQKYWLDFKKEHPEEKISK